MFRFKAQGTYMYILDRVRSALASQMCRVRAINQRMHRSRTF